MALEIVYQPRLFAGAFFWPVIYPSAAAKPPHALRVDRDYPVASRSMPTVAKCDTEVQVPVTRLRWDCVRRRYR